jgi:hypothetical protein
MTELIDSLKSIPNNLYVDSVQHKVIFLSLYLGSEIDSGVLSAFQWFAFKQKYFVVLNLDHVNGINIHFEKVDKE